MHKLIFACFAAGKKDASRALLLVESMRTFAGEFAKSDWQQHLLVDSPLKDWLEEREKLLSRC